VTVAVSDKSPKHGKSTYLEVGTLKLFDCPDLPDDKECQNDNPDGLYDEKEDTDGSGVGVQVEGPDTIG